jgi:transposase InsO family protein
MLRHSDRGSQYCSHEYQDLLTQYGNVMPGWWQHETLRVHYRHQTPSAKAGCALFGDRFEEVCRELDATLKVLGPLIKEL